MRAVLVLATWFGGLLMCPLGGCGSDAHKPPGAGTGATAAIVVSPPPAEHDFGVIPHGEKRSHDYELDVHSLGGDYVPLRAQLDCSCGRAELLLRHRNGTERRVDGSPFSPNAPTADETLIARITIDTLTKEAVDIQKTTVRGYVVLQPVHDRDGSLRLQWPILIHFGIESPVVLRPFAELDFAKVSQASAPELLTTLAGDAAHPGVIFGAITCSDAAITATLEPQGDHVVLRARCQPGQIGNHQAVLQIATNLPGGYHVNLPVKWKVVPELEAAPMTKLSFRTDLSREQPAAASQSQYLIVVDHNPQRTAEFTVQTLVSDDGRDARSSFEVTFQPLPEPQQWRMFVRYLGGQPNGFRGHLTLSKGGAAGPFLSIELVAFAAKAP